MIERRLAVERRTEVEPKRAAASMRIAAVGDLHCRRTPAEDLLRLFELAAQKADVLVLCGDLTDFGLPEEAKTLAAALKPVAAVPIVAVLGNHDLEAHKDVEVTRILSGAGVRVLDGDGWEYRGVGFAGTKGFMGGFRGRQLQSWGEVATKLWVKEATDEALKLERALARLGGPTRIVVLHYSPIPDTVAGEPLEIFPFLGSSRLEEPINRFEVSAVVHGHAHHGTPEGRTSAGIPVYNVALPLLKRQVGAPLPFRVMTFPAAAEGNGAR